MKINEQTLMVQHFYEEEKGACYITRYVWLEKIMRFYNKEESVFVKLVSNNEYLEKDELKRKFNEYDDLIEYDVIMLNKGERIFFEKDMKWKACMDDDDEIDLSRPNFDEGIDTTEFEKEVYLYCKGLGHPANK
jgi:hypothetical protein